MTTTEALKLCPLCGSAAESYSTRESFGAKFWHRIRCVNHCCHIELNGRQTEDEAIAAWNRRATTSTEQQAPVAEVVSHTTAVLYDEMPMGTLLYAAPVVPEGWKLVPIAPTPEMVKAAYERDHDGTTMLYFKIYEAMLAAAITPQDALQQEK